VRSRRGAEREMVVHAARLSGLQERLYAEGTRALLLVLQGMDTSGKDGTISHVVRAVNPLGVRITSFRVPTAEEKRHHYLWRIRRALPKPGEIGVFNRSHYEEVLVVRVHRLVPKRVWEPRFEEVNRFEADVAAAGTTVVKVCLHISFEEQRGRLLARLDDPTKRWKFKPGDLDERKRWDAYRRAYEEALSRCSTEAAPWYVVPADRKWYRNWAVGRLLVESLEAMDPRYPQPDLDIEALRARIRGS